MNFISQQKKLFVLINKKSKLFLFGIVWEVFVNLCNFIILIIVTTIKINFYLETLSKQKNGKKMLACVTDII